MHELKDPHTATLVALPDKLEAQHLLSLLPSLGYQAVMRDTGASAPDIQMPLYFTHAQMVVLPPSTDNPENSRSKLNGIEANMNRAISDGDARLLHKDLIFFPVFEEWQASMSFSCEPRQHWVLLVYLKAANTLYLLDAMGSNRSKTNYGQKLAHMDGAVRNALAKLNFAVKHPLVKMYFNWQWLTDTVSGGHWVSYWLYRFNQQGFDFAALKSEMTTKNLQDVKADLTRVRQAAMPAVKEEIVEDSDHGLETPLNLVIVENIERQCYAQSTDPNTPTNSTSRSCSILFSPSNVIPKKVATPPYLSEQSLRANTRPWYRFNLDFYSMLIYAGAAIALFAMFCLASATPLLSATLSAGALGVGVVVFLGGVLGKCGFFSSHSPLPHTKFSLAQHNSSLQV